MLERGKRRPSLTARALPSSAEHFQTLPNRVRVGPGADVSLLLKAAASSVGLGGGLVVASAVAGAALLFL